MWGGTKDAYPPFREPTKGKKISARANYNRGDERDERRPKRKKIPPFSHLREGGKVNGPPSLPGTQSCGGRIEGGGLIWCTWRWLGEPTFRHFTAAEWKTKAVSGCMKGMCPLSLSDSFPSESLSLVHSSYSRAIQPCHNFPLFFFS